MRQPLLVLVLLGNLPLGVAQAQTPETPVRLVVDTLYGTLVPDPYRWLEEADSARTGACTSSHWMIDANGGVDREDTEFMGPKGRTAILDFAADFFCATDARPPGSAAYEQFGPCDPRLRETGEYRRSCSSTKTIGWSNEGRMCCSYIPIAIWSDAASGVTKLAGRKQPTVRGVSSITM